MRKIIASVVAVLTMLVAGLVVAQPASANENGPDIGDWQFYTGLVCMADGAPEYNVAEAAQQWNIRTNAADPDINFGISAKNNCVTAGYPPSRRFTIDVIHDSSVTWCIAYGNQERDQYGRWTNNPYALVNDKATCPNVNHYISQAIGLIMGLRTLNSTGYNSRVMNNTSWSIANVSYPGEYDGIALALQYVTPYGTN